MADECRSDFSPERVLLGRESLALLTAALRELPERTRDVLMLRCFEGLKHAEIARLQGTSLLVRWRSTSSGRSRIWARQFSTSRGSSYAAWIKCGFRARGGGGVA